jgi:hypothetical protein
MKSKVPRRKCDVKQALRLHAIPEGIAPGKAVVVIVDLALAEQFLSEIGESLCVDRISGKVVYLTRIIVEVEHDPHLQQMARE